MVALRLRLSRTPSSRNASEDSDSAVSNYYYLLFLVVFKLTRLA